MREIRTSGLMSGIWKRKQRSDIQTPTNRKGRKQLRLNLILPRQISTLLHCYWQPMTMTQFSGKATHCRLVGERSRQTLSRGSEPRLPRRENGSISVLETSKGRAWLPATVLHRVEDSGAFGRAHLLLQSQPGRLDPRLLDPLQLSLQGHLSQSKTL
jgi:hypothetical protein